MAKPRLFVSHLSTEGELARLLKASLQEDFLDILDVFVSSDKKSIQAGSSWLDDLKTALSETRVVIVLCSNESINRPWVHFEAGAGWIRNVPVIPVCHSGLVPTDLPIPLNLLQAVQANQADDLRTMYERIANLLDMRVPNRNFTALAAEIRRFEEERARSEHARGRIEQPKVLCAATEQYARPELGFDLDVAIVQKSFAADVTVVRDLNSTRLRQLLTTQRFDIIHLVQAVDPSNGDLLFNRVDFPSYIPVGDRPDKMSAAGFADLVVEAGASLVVLNTCQALFLAARVAPVANMIATHAEITGEAAAGWAECFYDLLAEGYPLYRAYELTGSSVADVQMALIRHKDFAIGNRRRSDQVGRNQGAG